MKVVYCAHQFSPKENIGDVLSARGINNLYGNTHTKLVCLPQEVGISSSEEIIYGGGGMIRPHFSEREVFADFRTREKSKSYIIYGVGINKDKLVREFSFDDLWAISEWIRSAKTVVVRDRYTKEFLQERLGLSKIKIAPCPTYTILQTVHPFYISRKFTLGIVPSFGHTSTYLQFLPQIKSLIIGLVESVGYERVALICHDKQDFAWANKLFNKKGVKIYLPRTFKEVKTCYLQCDSIISFRAHGIIFAAACGKPCSPVTLNLKIDALFNFHYGEKPLGLDFIPTNHLLFVKENIFPKQIETPSKGELIN